MARRRWASLSRACCWGLGGSSASDKVTFTVMSSSPGSQPSRALICVSGVGGLCLCSSPPRFLVASTSGELRSLLHFFPPAKLCGRPGGRESGIAFPASSRVRGWPSQGTDVAQAPCPFLPSVLSSGQASGCGVDLWGGECVLFDRCGEIS